jgi:hypothetical protein
MNRRCNFQLDSSRPLQRGRDVLIGGLVEAHMTVTDLDEMELSPGTFHALTKSLGTQNATADGPSNTSADPRHAFQKTSTVNAIIIVIVSY